MPEMTQRSGVGDHARYLRVVAVGNKQGPSQLALHFGWLRRKDVTRLRLAPLDLAGASLAEALLRARMGLQLGHCFLVSAMTVAIAANLALKTGTPLPV